MAEAPSAAFASAVDYEKYGRYVSSTKLDEAQNSGSGTVFSAYKSLYPFKNRIRADGSTAFSARTGRYHLYLAKGCPFCHRLLIVLHLLELANVVSFSFVDDERDGRGWAFRARRGADPVNGFQLLSEAYRTSDPEFGGHISVPVLWDRETKTIVNNNSGDIVDDVATQFKALESTFLDLYPAQLRTQIDEFDAELEADVNFGVYLVGLAKNQAEYDVQVRRLFDALEALETRLGESRFLFGDRLVESDIRLWVTLARFDVGYFTTFRANLKRLVDFPNLWAYARDLYRIPAFRDFTDFDQYKADYIRNFPSLNPSGIIPIGPVADWSEDPCREPKTRGSF